MGLRAAAYFKLPEELKQLSRQFFLAQCVRAALKPSLLRLMPCGFDGAVPAHAESEDIAYDAHRQGGQHVKHRVLLHEYC